MKAAGAKVLTDSINRNIVECKDYDQLNVFFILSGINRNIVECKEFQFCFINIHHLPY